MAVVGRSVSTAIVACVPIDDVSAMIAALAEPEALLVFGAIVTATSTAGQPDELGSTSENSYVTPFAVEKKTSLPRATIEKAARRLERAGLLVVLPDEERGFDSWRVNEAALAAASTRSPKGSALLL